MKIKEKEKRTELLTSISIFILTCVFILLAAPFVVGLYIKYVDMIANIFKV